MFCVFLEHILSFLKIDKKLSASDVFSIFAKLQNTFFKQSNDDALNANANKSFL